MTDRRPARGGRVCAALAAALAALLLTPAPAWAARVEVQRLLDTTPLGDPFVFDVAPDGGVLVLTGDNVYDAGAGAHLFGTPLQKPAWLDLGGGVLRIVADDGLYEIGGGAPRLLVEVPLATPVLATDGARTFVAGVSPDGRATLFLHQAGKGHKALLEVDERIDAMATAGGALFFSAGNAIFALREGGPVRRLAHLPAVSRILSLAVDPRRGVLYFSDGDAVFALRGEDLVVVRRSLGGMLRWRGDDLYVLSWREHALFRLRGLGAVLAAPGAVAPWKDPCLDPVIGLYCRAAVGRALEEASVGGAPAGPGPRDAAASEADPATARRTALAQVESSLAAAAAAGAQAVVWTGDAGPRTVREKARVVTGAHGEVLTLWDGSELRVGPDSRAVLGGCRPAEPCRHTLERGLLYLSARSPPSDGTAPRSPQGFAVTAGDLSLTLAEGRVAVFTSEALTAVLVLEGRVRGATSGRGEVTVSAGEVLEVRRGEPAGVPAAIDPSQINRWWEKIR